MCFLKTPEVSVANCRRRRSRHGPRSREAPSHKGFDMSHNRYSNLELEATLEADLKASVSFLNQSTLQPERSSMLFLTDGWRNVDPDTCYF